MNSKSNFALVVSLVAIVIAVGAYIYPKQVEQTPSATLGVFGTRFPNGLAVSTSTEPTRYKLTIGNSGTAIAQVIATTCALGTQGAASINSTHAASTTASYDCAVTGARSGDMVFAQFATSTPSATAGGVNSWVITGAKASTTNGFISVNVWNGGPSVIPSTTSIGSTTNVLLIRN